MPIVESWRIQLFRLLCRWWQWQNTRLHPRGACLPDVRYLYKPDKSGRLRVVEEAAVWCYSTDRTKKDDHRIAMIDIDLCIDAALDRDEKELLITGIFGGEEEWKKRYSVSYSDTGTLILPEKWKRRLENAWLKLRNESARRGLILLDRETLREKPSWMTEMETDRTEKKTGMRTEKVSESYKRFQRGESANGSGGSTRPMKSPPEKNGSGSGKERRR
jgi:hypothetical protein